MGKRKKIKRIAPPPDFSSPFDPEGSWTGNYLLGELEEPVQDVDDL